GSDKGRAIHKGDLGRLIGRTKGGMNTKLHAVSDADGRPLSFSFKVPRSTLIDMLKRTGWAGAGTADKPG
ncbi:MAG: hypothetical protein WCZ28_18000, partial [Burkholderiaceae bacterium]